MKMSVIEKALVNSPSHSTQVARHADTLLQTIEFGSGATYLDVGCGNGAAPFHLARKYHLNVTGVDVDAAQIREAKVRSTGVANVEFFVLDGTRLPFEDGTFDIVATNKVMHHVPTWPIAFAEMVRVLRPGGHLLFSDLVVPRWLASMGTQLLGQVVGLPTRQAIDDLSRLYQLARIYDASTWIEQKSVFRKPLLAQ